MGKSDPYVCILLVTKCGSLKFLNKTEVKMNDLNPNWEEINIEIKDEDLNGQDLDSTLLCFEVLDYDNKKKSDFLCSVVRSLSDVKVQNAQFDLETKKKKKKGKL